MTPDDSLKGTGPGRVARVRSQPSHAASAGDTSGGALAEFPGNEQGILVAVVTSGPFPLPALRGKAPVNPTSVSTNELFPRAERGKERLGNGRHNLNGTEL